MKRKRFLALALALCLLAIPILSSCSSSDIVDALNSLDKDDIDSIASDVESIVNDHKGSTPSSKQDDINFDNNGNNGNGNGHGNNGNGNGNNGNSGSGNNGNTGNGNGNNGGGNGNGGSGSQEKPSPIEIIDSELGLVFTLSEDESYYSVSALKSSKKESISIPSEYDGLPVYNISSNAFSACVNIKSITIPRSIVSIGSFAFFRCESLENIYIQASVQTMGAYAFDGCSSLSIYCEASSKPKGWNNKWNPDDCPVQWGYICQHQWLNATCTTPYACSICGTTDGEALGHQWSDATCTEAKQCSVCGEIGEEALGHQWSDATCTEAKKCSVCGEIGEEALGHNIINGECTRCDYVEEIEEEDEIITPAGKNIASLATVVSTDSWWASDPRYLIDGDRSTASLNSNRLPSPSFVFTWDKLYSISDILLIMNGKGTAPMGGVTYKDYTENVYSYDVILYNENGDVVYEARSLQASGENRYTLLSLNDVVASQMELKIYSMYTPYPIFEVEVYGEENKCEHVWAEATCTESAYCEKCGLESGDPLGHRGGKASCMAQASCEVCSVPYGELASHSWDGEACSVCSIKRALVKFDEIESIIPSHGGESAENLEKLFDGDKTSTGIFGNASTEYYPEAVGDTLTITLKNEIKLQSLVLWTCGNWTTLEITIYDEAGNETGRDQVVYCSDSPMMETTSTPVEITFDTDYINAKTIVLEAWQLKWESGKTQKTSEIEIIKKDHIWQEATCQAPKTCIICGMTEGEASEHLWQDATCNRAKYCTECGKTEGAPLAHEWQDPSCYEPRTCTVCGTKNGSPYYHVFLDGICYVCGQQDTVEITYNTLSGTVRFVAVPNSNGTYTLLEEKLSRDGTIKKADGTVVEKEFYGWFDEEGNLYAPGSVVAFQKSTRLYEAYGTTVYSTEDLISAAGSINGEYYLKLGTDIMLEERVGYQWNALIIDLNGHTLTSTAREEAFSVMRGSFIVLGEGELIHAPAMNSTNVKASTVSFSAHGYGDQSYPQLFWVGKGVTIKTPYSALYVKSVILTKTPNVVIAGSVEAKSLIYVTPTTQKAFLRITEDAEVSIDGSLVTFEKMDEDGVRMLIVSEKDNEAIERGVIELIVKDGALQN